MGDTVLPKESVLLVPTWIVHCDERTFADPLRFAGNWKKRYPRYACFPFGGGP